MKNYVRFAIAAILAYAFSVPAFAWTGPQVSLDNKNGRKVIKICDQGGGCTQSTPFFLALNSNAASIQNKCQTTRRARVALGVHRNLARAAGK